MRRHAHGFSLFLIGSILGAISVSPAFAHHQATHTKKQIRAVRHLLNTTLSGLQGQLADAATQFGPTTIANGNSAPLISEGPLTVVGKCEADGTDLEANVIIATAEDGTAFGATNALSGSIGPSTPEGDRYLQDGTASSSGPPEHGYGYDDQFSAITPSGTAINGTVSVVAHKDAGTCRYYGHYTTV